MIDYVKPPRQYAFDCFKAKTQEAKRIALQGCPVEWRELVTAHIKCWNQLKEYNERARQ